MIRNYPHSCLQLEVHAFSDVQCVFKYHDSQDVLRYDTALRYFCSVQFVQFNNEGICILIC